MARQEWLARSPFNLLIDYYPEVPFRPYGSAATRENTLPWLRELRPGYVCIYAKGHSGCTTWPSSLGTAHPMLAQDMPAFFRDVTREAGVRLVLYYSGLLDGIAGLRHPDWRMQGPDGAPREFFADFGFTGYGICPLSAYWDEWASVQVRELIENYAPDGIWVDGDWPGPCYCPRCQARFREDTGWTALWDELRQRSDFAARYLPVWKRIEHEWRTRFNAFVKSLAPDCIYSAGNVSARREYLAPFDWRSGDFFTPGHFLLGDIARMMRWYGTLGVPYDAYVCDTSFTHHRKHVRSRSKTLDRMLQEAATVAANGGAVGYWTYPTGHGALVPSRMRKAVAVRRFVDERREIFTDTRSLGWTAVVAAEPSGHTFGSNAVAGAHKALAALHCSPEPMDETGVAADMPHALLVLPEQAEVDSATVARLEAYVRRGGRLLSSGASIVSPDLQGLLGVELEERGAVEDGHVLLPDCHEPTGIDRPWDKLALREAEELYPLYLSWDQFNPEIARATNNWPMHGQLDEEHPEAAGFPAAVVRRLGQGCMVHVCTDVFAYYRVLGDPQILRWLGEIVAELDSRPLFTTDAPSWVDVSLRRKGDDLLIHLVSQNPGRDVARLRTDDLWVDEIPTLAPLTLRLRCDRAPAAVWLEPEHQPLEVAWHDGYAVVTLPAMRIHACVVVRDWLSRRDDR